MASKSATEQARHILAQRQIAYRNVFGWDDPTKPDAAKKAVLDDLGMFCREHESTFHPDPRLAANLDGRREVMLRIRDYLVLSLDELQLKYGRKA